MRPLEGKRILITGGTGSLGKTLVQRLLTGEMGWPQKICVFSRDEAKQYFMRLEHQRLRGRRISPGLHRSQTDTEDERVRFESVQNPQELPVAGWPIGIRPWLAYTGAMG